MGSRRKNIGDRNLMRSLAAPKVRYRVVYERVIHLHQEMMHTIH